MASSEQPPRRARGPRFPPAPNPSAGLPGMGKKCRHWDENDFRAAEDAPASKRQKPDEELGFDELETEIERHRRMTTQESARLARFPASGFGTV